jgi:predicted flap endonuclease-1-like 5' DNA nuclease
MFEGDNASDCARKCWRIGGGAGLLIWILLWVASGYGFFWSLVLGAVIGLLIALLMITFLCSAGRQGSDAPAPRSTGSSPAAGTSAGAGASVATDPAPVSGAPPASPAPEPAPPREEALAAADRPAPRAPEPATPAAEPKVKPSKALPGQAELASRKGDWKYQRDEGPSAVEKAPAKKPEPDAEVPAAGKDNPKAQKSAPAATAASADEAEQEPHLLQSPRNGKGDDLKRISGVGPRLEQTLNELGIWHFDQIAAWGDKEIAWVDHRVRFKGRIRRDDWVGQASALAAGADPANGQG